MLAVHGSAVTADFTDRTVKIPTGILRTSDKWMFETWFPVGRLNGVAKQDESIKQAKKLRSTRGSHCPVDSSLGGCWQRRSYTGLGVPIVR